MSSFTNATLTVALFGVLTILVPQNSYAHPMDSYAIDQYLDFQIQGNQINLIHRIEFAEIPTASELPRIDSDRDMSLSSAETVPYVQGTVDQLLKELVLTMDGEPLEWQYLQGEAFLDTIPSTRLKMVSEYRTSFSGDLASGETFRFDLRHRPTARGDRQTRIVTKGKTALEGVASSENIQPPGMAPPAIYETAALVYGHKTQWTLIASETEAPDEIPDFSIRQATGPVAPANPFLSLNNRELGAEIMGESPGGAGEPSSATKALTSLRDEGAPTFAEGAETKETQETWADRKFRQMFLDSEAGNASAWAFIGFSLLALLYGAAHALEPGHGKTVVAAYLVGAHGTVFHAVMLALIVTFTHTFSVYILGVIALTNLEKVQGTYLPILECGSWFLILCMGLWLFLKYYKYYVQGKLADPTFHTHGFGEGHTHLPDGSHAHSDDHPHPHDHGHSHDHHHHNHDKHTHPHDHDHGDQKHSHSHGQDHAHHHPHHDEGDAHKHTHDHTHDEAHSHSHGHEHSHEEEHSHEHPHEHKHDHKHDHDHSHDHGHSRHHEEEAITEVSFWNLLMLGVTGGIVPCPGALFVMMIALTSGAVLTGLYLISVFSVGLALTLMTVGITVVKGRGVIDKYAPNSRLIQIVPLCTSLLIAFVGMGFMINGLVKHGILVLNF